MKLTIHAALVRAADEGEGWRWTVRMIAPGLSLNGVYYPEDVLRRCAPVFEGVRALARSDRAHRWDDDVSVHNLVGWFEGVEYVEAQGLHAAFTMTEDADWLRKKMLGAWRRGKSDLVGFSIVAEGKGERREHMGQYVLWVQDIHEAQFVDCVVRPAAGGRLLAMLEAQRTQEESMSREQLLALIESKWPWLMHGLNRETATLEQLTAVLADVPPGDAPREPLRASAPAVLYDASGRPWVYAPAAPGPAATAVAGPPATTATSAVALAEAQALTNIRTIERRWQMRDLLLASQLPAVVHESLEQRFSARLERGEVWDVSELTEAIAAQRTILASLSESGMVRGFGQTQAQITEDRDEKVVQQLLDFFDNTPGAHSFRAAYVALTGDTQIRASLSGRVALGNWQRVAEAKGIRIRASISSATFDAVLADVMHKRFIDTYLRPDLQLWREIVVIGSIDDFKTQHRTRIGGYGNLPTVGEGAPYTALTSPTDEEATFVPAKRGGTEDLTWEAILNDDANVIRFIPIKLGIAAGQTLLEFVFDFLATNPTIYDSVALYHGDHGNLATTAFGTDTAQFMAHRLLMQAQTELDSAKRLGYYPAFLLGPINLQEVMYNVFRRTTENDAKFAQTVAPRVLTPHYWTDTNNWFTLADPMIIPTIEICFLMGEQEPEILVQDDPRQGAPFSNDKRLYKVRHVYGGAVRDYRGTTGAIVT